VGSIELLSPAGNWECLKAALSEGADAVYLGVDEFNARQRANNFSLDELRKVVVQCHINGVKCYVAANTLVKNAELTRFRCMLENAYSAGVDAFIVQHLSIIEPLKDNLPDIEVHVSTQAGIFNTHIIPLIDKAERIIMPREMPLKHVKEFRERTGKDVEVFVHGALCFSISGQCLMSSFLGGRSGNRGLCAQPCRKTYNGRYLLSTRDLCLVKRLPEILDSKVSSLKIEGRLRSPGYVGAATALYRRAIDSIKNGEFNVDIDSFKDLELSFNRDFTEGGLFKEYSVVTPEECGKRGLFLGKIGKGNIIRLNERIFKGDGVGIITKNGVHGDIIRRIESKGESLVHAGSGQTVRLFINAHEGDDIFLTSGLPRRKKYNLEPRGKIIKKPGKSKLSFPYSSHITEGSPQLLVRTYSLNDAYSAIDAGASHVYYNIFSKDYDYDDSRLNPYVPKALSEWNADKAIEIIDKLQPKSILSADIGVAAKVKNVKVFSDISSNTFNDIDVGFYNKAGIIPIVSPELTFNELTDFTDKRFAVYSHGRIPLMTTKYLIDEVLLMDEIGYEFPLRSEIDQRQILNSVPLGLFGEVTKLLSIGIKYFYLDLSQDVDNTIKTYVEILKGNNIVKPKGFTLGHFKDAID
jgi:collagenase-like PrtC family protease